MFKKYSIAKITDKGTIRDIKSLSKTASKSDKDFQRRVLEKIAKIPEIQANPDDYVVIRNRSISALETYGANQNHDAFPSKELQTKYSTFIDCPVDVDHINESDNDVIGIVLDSMYVPKQIYRKGELIPFDENGLMNGDQLVGDYVENLLCIDKKRADKHTPGLVEGILKGEVTDTSMGCFTEDTVITTDKGYIFIKDIKEGDLVRTHTGQYKKVTSLFEKEHLDGIYNIKVQGLGEEFKVTYEHPFYTIRKEELDCINFTNKFNDNSTCHPESYLNKQCISKKCDLSKNREYNIEWIKTQNLRVGDYVAYTFNDDIEYDENESIEFARILGYYLSDGCIGPGTFFEGTDILKDASLVFTLGINENNLVEDISHCIKKLIDYDVKVKVRDNIINVMVHNTKFANKIYQYASKNVWNKKLCDKVMKWNPKTQLHILATFINGDGFESNGTLFAETVNRYLIEQLKQIASRNRIIWTLLKQVYPQGSIYTPNRDTVTWKLYFAKNQNYLFEGICQKATYFSQTRWSNRKFYYKNHLFSKISKIEFDEEWKGKIYNFEVEDDNSYIANDVTVHNCTVKKSICSVCGNVAETEDDFCDHILIGKGKKFKVGKKEIRAYEINEDIEFFEDSVILSESFARKANKSAQAGGEGADASAKILEVVSGEKTAKKKTGTILDYIKDDKITIGEEPQEITDKKEELADEVEDSVKEALKKSKSFKEFKSKVKLSDLKAKSFYKNFNKAQDEVLAVVSNLMNQKLEKEEIIEKLEKMGYNKDMVEEAITCKNKMDGNITAKLKDFLIKGYEILAGFERGDNQNRQTLEPLEQELNRYTDSLKDDAVDMNYNNNLGEQGKGNKMYEFDNEGNKRSKRAGLDELYQRYYELEKERKFLEEMEPRDLTDEDVVKHSDITEELFYLDKQIKKYKGKNKVGGKEIVDIPEDTKDKPDDDEMIKYNEPDMKKQSKNITKEQLQIGKDYYIVYNKGSRGGLAKDACNATLTDIQGDTYKFDRWYYGDNNEKVSWDDEIILTANEIDRGAVQTVSRPKKMKDKLKAIRKKIGGLESHTRVVLDELQESGFPYTWWQGGIEYLDKGTALVLEGPDMKVMSEDEEEIQNFINYVSREIFIKNNYEFEEPDKLIFYFKNKRAGINAKEYLKGGDSLKNGAGKDDGMINKDEVDMEQKKINIEDYKDLKLRDNKHSTDDYGRPKLSRVRRKLGFEEENLNMWTKVPISEGKKMNPNKPYGVIGEAVRNTGMYKWFETSEERDEFLRRMNRQGLKKKAIEIYDEVKTNDGRQGIVDEILPGGDIAKVTIYDMYAEDETTDYFDVKELSLVEDYPKDQDDALLNDDEWTDPAGGTHQGTFPNMKQYEKKKSLKLHTAPNDEQASMKSKDNVAGEGKVKKDTYKSDEKEKPFEVTYSKLKKIREKISGVSTCSDELYDSYEEKKKEFGFEYADELDSKDAEGNLEKELKKKSNFEPYEDFDLESADPEKYRGYSRVNNKVTKTLGELQQLYDDEDSLFGMDIWIPDAIKRLGADYQVTLNFKSNGTQGFIKDPKLQKYLDDPKQTKIEFWDYPKKDDTWDEEYLEKEPADFEPYDNDYLDDFEPFEEIDNYVRQSVKKGKNFTTIYLNLKNKYSKLSKDDIKERYAAVLDEIQMGDTINVKNKDNATLESPNQTVSEINTLTDNETGEQYNEYTLSDGSKTNTREKTIEKTMSKKQQLLSVLSEMSFEDDEEMDYKVSKLAHLKKLSIDDPLIESQGDLISPNEIETDPGTVENINYDEIFNEETADENTMQPVARKKRGGFIISSNSFKDKDKLKSPEEELEDNEFWD